MSDAEVLARLMRARQSCRAFRPDPLSDATITEIVDSARWAASWSNIQPWDQMIVTRPETTARLSKALLAEAEARPEIASDIPYPESYPEPYMARRREVGFGLYAALGIAREDRAARHEHHLKNFRFFGAPYVALLSVPRAIGPYALLDIGAFVGTFMLAAQARGIGSVAQAALAQHAGVVRRFFDLPEDRDFVCGISFGHPAEHAANRFRSSRIEPEAFFRLT
ncbi:MAG: nitroreductase [Paracoccus sp. BP8]|uniref:nitroreductase n=1 Tax=Paracoccus sp. J39 TaxID=935848 RepID=UPI00048C92E7|nr:nitroreductase [Paracoccus sp. J39]RQP04104.1 MAG: nitroreductase [Paracoccus sp. BP8]